MRASWPKHQIIKKNVSDEARDPFMPQFCLYIAFPIKWKQRRNLLSYSSNYMHAIIKNCICSFSSLICLNYKQKRKKKSTLLAIVNSFRLFFLFSYLLQTTSKKRKKKKKSTLFTILNSFPSGWEHNYIFLLRFLTQVR